MLHWNIIHKSTGVTLNVGPYMLIGLPGHYKASRACNIYSIGDERAKT